MPVRHTIPLGIVIFLVSVSNDAIKILNTKLILFSIDELPKETKRGSRYDIAYGHHAIPREYNVRVLQIVLLVILVYSTVRSSDIFTPPYEVKTPSL